MTNIVVVLLSLLMLFSLIILFFKIRQTSPIERLKDFYYHFLRIESEALRALNKEPTGKLVSLFARLESYLYQFLKTLRITGNSVGEMLRSQALTVFFTPKETELLRRFVEVAFKIRQNSYVPVREEIELLYKTTKMLKQKCENAIKT